jgi:hypothetical protein
LKELEEERLQQRRCYRHQHQRLWQALSQKSNPRVVEVVEVVAAAAAEEDQVAAAAAEEVVVVAAAEAEEEVFQATFPVIIFSLCHQIVQYLKLFNK